MSKTEQVNAAEISVGDKIRFGESDLEVVHRVTWESITSISFRMTRGNKVALVLLPNDAFVDRVMLVSTAREQGKVRQ